MPWETQTDSISLAASEVNKKVGKTFRTEVEKFPIAYRSLVEAGAKTYTIGFEYSMDNENWSALQSTGSLTTGSVSFNDLSDESSKPTGAAYFRSFMTPSATLSIGESAVANFTFAWWVDDSNVSSGARSI
tara:strand:+ start:145 stop:537 length:393 start_codon:yes stop_codon:yes gene_type:complete